MGAYNAESDEDNMSEFVNINLKNLVNQNHVKKNLSNLLI